MRFLAFVVTGLWVAPAFADEPYHLPPQAIVDLVDAAPTPAATLSPDRRTLLLAESPALPPIGEVAAPQLRLAGLRFYPRIDAAARRTRHRGLSLLDLGDPQATPRAISGFPGGAALGDVAFSPDGKKVAVTVTSDAAVTLWIADVATRKAARLTPARMSAVMGAPCHWLPDSRGLVCRVVPGGRGAPPVAKAVPVGPVVLQADRDRIAIGGHSYGAFTTANLLAHSELFRAGIARSGAYNRTLTPFGFQQEERTYWDARAVYQDMSPFNFADKIDRPILLIHGDSDDNTGTYPIQSQRLFEALQGLGKHARLVFLPAEAHGYRARETILHVMWEMLTWLDTHVKNATIKKSA
jgi:dipeptidyl aminopeptidase/acylaminoacyl peptidase